MIRQVIFVATYPVMSKVNKVSPESPFRYDFGSLLVRKPGEFWSGPSLVGWPQAGNRLPR